MKVRVLFVSILLLFGMVLTGCGAKPAGQDVKNLADAFVVNAKVSYEDFIAMVKIERVSVGVYTMEVNEPENIKGLTFSILGEEIKASYKGLDLNLDKNTFLSSSIIKTIVNSLDKAISQQDVESIVKDGNVVVSGQSDTLKFDVIINGETGELISIEIPSVKFKLEVIVAEQTESSEG